MELTKKFQRTKEDFSCAHCGNMVMGNGYTNHCPKCLWSMHVDNNPGDRLARCGGLMEPVRVEGKGREYMIVHRCVTCGHTRRNSVSEEDDFEVVVRLSKDLASR